MFPCSDIFKVYCADHTYTTIRLPINSTVKDIVLSARDKLCLGHDPVLCEVKSNGGELLPNIIEERNDSGKLTCCEVAWRLKFYKLNETCSLGQRYRCKTVQN